MIPLVVIATLLSLVESPFILPAHLAHSGKRRRGSSLRCPETAGVSRALESFVEKVYTPLARVVAEYRYVGRNLASMMITVGMCAGDEFQLSAQD